MKLNRTDRLWIGAEITLCLLPLGLLLMAPVLGIDQAECSWILFSCFLGCLLSALTLWFSRKTLAQSSPEVFRQLIWLIPAMQYGFLFILLLALKQPDAEPGSLMNILLGLMFIVMGNILPKSEQNLVFGVRTRWTLANRENWNRTARLTGFIWVISGFLCWLAVLFRMPFAFDILLILAVASSPVLISWMVYRKQIQEGTWKEDPTGLKNVKLARPVKILLVVISAAAILFCLFIFTVGGQYTISLADGRLRLESSLVSNAEIPLNQTESLVLKEPGNIGSRSFGYSAFGTDLGRYENSEYGSYTRYTSGDGPVIELKTTDKTYVFGYRDPARTQELFEELRQVLISLNSQAAVQEETGLSS